ncbi:MAG: 16S rRNA (cytosine(1402)-N(4))-methyltransferase RsmH [Acidobacteriota bacterium]|nr:16S rRNA (cytosine(1402)-N(4))-methyltransferase RsmH [Acidobacteriota bacterium]
MEHVPVLLEETIRLLAPQRGGVFVDCTVGLGGHAEALLSANADVRIVGIDRDPEALERTRVRLARFGERLQLIEGDFGDLAELLEAVGLHSIAGLLADVGVSSLQLESAGRGFSFRREGPLDMRMGRSGPTAEEIVNRYSEAALQKIFAEFGEERRARRLARAVVEERKKRKLRTTGELRELILRVKRRRPGQREGRIDPATRVFQALRIEVNRELEQLSELVDQAVRLLDQDGRLVVISYHSLEDRIVKNALRRLAVGKVDEVTGRPHAQTRLIEVLTRKPVRPGEREVSLNPRARSARLRAARRL